MKKFRCANKGFILSSLKARNLMWKSLLRMARGQKSFIFFHSISFLYFLRKQYLY